MLRCNQRKAALQYWKATLQESGGGFPPDFRLPRLGPADLWGRRIHAISQREGPPQRSTMIGSSWFVNARKMFLTFYDDLWRFMSSEQRDGNCHKMMRNVVKCRDVCRKLSWPFFCRPLPAVPFGFLLKTRTAEKWRDSSGVSGGSLHKGTSFKVEKARFAAWKRVRRTAKMK